MLRHSSHLQCGLGETWKNANCITPPRPRSLPLSRSQRRAVSVNFTTKPPPPPGAINQHQFDFVPFRSVSSSSDEAPWNDWQTPIELSKCSLSPSTGWWVVTLSFGEVTMGRMSLRAARVEVLG